VRPWEDRSTCKSMSMLQLTDTERQNLPQSSAYTGRWCLVVQEANRYPTDVKPPSLDSDENSALNSALGLGQLSAVGRWTRWFEA
jgi:hypothetical protein